MRLPTKWVGLHHVDKRRFELKTGIPQVELGSHGHISAEEPATFVVAERDAEWRRAMIEEMKVNEANKT
jgi:hypothetical protein